jgi:hypothetical protein
MSSRFVDSNKSEKECNKLIAFLLKNIRRRKTIAGTIIITVITLFTACNWTQILGYAITVFAVLFEFFGQYINVKSDRYIYMLLVRQ